LRTGIQPDIQPDIGQRVELTIILSPHFDNKRGQIPFRLSGEVVSACAPNINIHTRNDSSPTSPAYSKEKIQDTPADIEQLPLQSNSGGSVGSNSTHSQTAISTLRPSTSEGDYGGSVMLSHMIGEILMKHDPSRLITSEDMSNAWQIASNNTKEEIINAIIRKLGAVHGHRVVCQGR
jgi:hypothetical protein